MTPFDRHLQAARGYLELGLPLEAHEELEDVEPEMCGLSEILAVRVEAFRALEKQPLMEAVARQFYHIACYMARLGHLDIARKWLAEAIALKPVYRERAPTWHHCKYQQDSRL